MQETPQNPLEVSYTSDVQLMHIRDLVHAAKLLKTLKLKQFLIEQQLLFVRNFLKENS